MSEQIMVSVVCNAFNHGKYIKDTLEGFVTQKTNFPFEVLVHDDASTDNTADIIREYEAKYPELIKPICQTENQYSQKININRTYQIPRIKGKYVALCEGDDYWTDPLKLQKQVDFMEANPDCTMCGCSVAWLNMETNTMSHTKCSTSEDREITLEEIILEKKGRPMQTASFLILADIYKEKVDWAFKFPAGDVILLLKSAIRGKVYMLADEMAVYRNLAPGSWTARMKNDTANKIATYDKFLAGWESFNEGTGLKYNDLVTKRIKMVKYLKAKKTCDWKTIRSEELREIYSERTFKQRMADMIQCKMPKLYDKIMKFIHN